jgi:hypothetical protein
MGEDLECDFGRGQEKSRESDCHLRQAAESDPMRDSNDPAIAGDIITRRKVRDEFTVPLCRGHHREVHRCGDEAAWWRKVGVDPTVAARTLWLQTRPLSAGRPHHLTT